MWNSDSEKAPQEPRGVDDQSALSVSELTLRIKGLLEGSLPRVWVEGEISDLSRPSSGHIYMTLKDDHSQIRAVIWRSVASRLQFRVEDGLSIVGCGGVEVYSPRGSYQLVITRLQLKGIGALQLAFRQLHAKLAAEGLFDADRKRPLPRFPKRIGFVTSPSGAALHDFMEAAKVQWPALDLLVIPAKVQGAEAAREVSEGIRAAQRVRPALDVLIVGRGGGSIEDLWCFNEEIVIRALAACTIPTVSAVGHEIDVTLSDLAADARALTPTHAAQLILPNYKALAEWLVSAKSRLNHTLYSRIRLLKVRLAGLAMRRAIRHPHDAISQRRQTLDEWELRGRAAVWNQLARKRQQLEALTRAAHALSPLQVLGRGYSLTMLAKTGKLITSANEVTVGQSIESILSGFRLVSQVTKITQEQ